MVTINDDSTNNASLLNIRQAAKILNVHPDTLRRWEKQGELKSIRMGSRRDRRYKIEDIHSLINPSLSIGISNTKELKQNNQKIRLAFEKADWVFFDVGYTLLTLFPSRGTVYADLAFDDGYNLKPNFIQENFDKLEKEWEEEKILSQPLTKVSQEIAVQHYSQFNAEVLMLSGIPRNKQIDAVGIGRKIFNSVFSSHTLWKELDGVREFLTLLKKNKKKLAIVENWDQRLNKLIKEWKLNHFFEFIITGGTINLRKPDDKIFKMALDRSQSKPSSAIYVGDKYTEDVIGPEHIGMIPVLFDYQRKYTDKNCLSFYTYQKLIDLLT